MTSSSSSHGSKKPTKRKADESELGWRSGQGPSKKPTPAAASPAANNPLNQGPAAATKASLHTLLPVDNQNRDIRNLASTRPLPEEESGIVYIEDKFRIEMQGGSSSLNIGLLTKEGHGLVKLKRDIQELDLSAKLEAAWSLTTMNVSKQQFCTKLWEVVPSLSKTFVKNAWHTLMDNYELDVEHMPSKTTFQQGICIPFARLLMAAGSVNGLAERTYKANEDVCSSMAVIRKPKEDESATQKCKLSVRSDSAATLHRQWDAFGMMEINARDHDLIDHDKCVLMTAATTRAVRKCIQKEDYEKVLLPFIISRGDCATLYVTGLNEAGTPVVYFVRYPDGSNSRWADLSKSPCKSKTKLFIAFAVLLNNFKQFFETSVKEEYMKQVKKRTPLVQQLETYAPSRCTAGQFIPDRLKEAGEHGGMFIDLVQTKSPFHFRGREAPSKGSREVFLKVWRVDQKKIASVKSEWQYYNKAFKAGIPVPNPVLSKLAVSTCSLGFAHLVLATEFIYQEYIDTIDDLWNFSFSLIQAVLMLHEKVQVLHCDIKPDNIRWNREGVRLIDFENAQGITNALYVPGTLGYRAPEILNGMPCSTKTDAFSVGRTISMKCKEFKFMEENLPSQEKEKYLILQDISVKLTDRNPESRWSLRQAFSAIQNYKATDSHI